MVSSCPRTSAGVFDSPAVRLPKRRRLVKRQVIDVDHLGRLAQRDAVPAQYPGDLQVARGGDHRDQTTALLAGISNYRKSHGHAGLISPPIPLRLNSVILAVDLVGLAPGRRSSKSGSYHCAWISS